MLDKNLKSNLLRTIGRLSVAGMVLAGVVAMTFAVSSPQPAYADNTITPPAVPSNIQVPAGNVAFLVGHAVGTQNYVCLPSGAGFRFVLFTPQATLFSDDGGQVITHYFSPNPFEGGTIRATWQHSRDTSTVWAKLHQDGSATVDPNAIAWLLLDVVGAQNGPIGGDKLTETTFIQRLNTTGGLAPSTGCGSLTDVGNQAFVPYTADYFFYRQAKATK
jgi:hypothetical protein